MRPRRVGPEGWGREGWGPKISRFFFPLLQNLFFSSLSGGFLVEFWCLKCRGPEMCTFGVLGLSCASPGGPVWWGRRGFTPQPKSPNVHMSGPRPSKHHQNSTRRHPSEGRKARNGGGKGKKKSEILGGQVQTSNNHTTAQNNTTTTQQQHNNNTQQQQKQQHLNIRQNTKTPKLAKVGLAKVGHDWCS